MAEKWRFSGFFTKTQLKRWEEQIPLRTDCRCFSGALKADQWAALSYAAARLCLPGVRMVLAACDESFFTPVFWKFGGIRGAVRFAAVIADTSVPRHLTHAGISGEALILEAASSGVGSCWAVSHYHKKESPVPLRLGEVLAAAIPLGICTEPSPQKRLPMGSLAQMMENGGKGWPEHALKAAQAAWLAPRIPGGGREWLSLGSQALSLMGKPDSLQTGIALLHLEAALWDVPRQWTLEPGGRAPAAKVMFTKAGE